jgi:TldD protein
MVVSTRVGWERVTNRVPGSIGLFNNDPDEFGMTAHYGEEIRNGKLTGRIFAPVGITGYVPDVLMSSSAIGSDFEVCAGMCGKGPKEMVPVSSGDPHMRMRARLG